MAGGYFRFDVSEELSIITLNSLFMSPRNVHDTAGDKEQLDWLEKELNEAENRKFIIQSHISPGV